MQKQQGKNIRKTQKDDLNLTLMMVFTEMISSYACLVTQPSEVCPCLPPACLQSRSEAQLVGSFS